MLLSSLAIMAGLFLAVATPLPVAADATDGSAHCTAPDGSAGIYIAIGIAGKRCIANAQGGLQGNPIFVYIVGIMQIASGLVGLAVVGGFVWGGLLYASARANAGQVEKAKLVMVNAIIGLFLFIFLFAILQFMIPGGIFT